jgi:hypothetical protein
MTGVCRPETALVVAVDHNWVFDFTPMRRDEPFSCENTEPFDNNFLYSS